MLVVATGMVFSAVCFLPIMKSWDDDVHIWNNTHLLTMTADNVTRYLTKPRGGYYVPLSFFSYMLDYAIGGTNGFSYHIQNLFWHMLTVLAFFFCLRFFLRSKSLAFCAALVFALHPQRVEAVAWVTARREVMCGFFYFMSALAYFVMRKDKGICLPAFVLFLMAIFSKPMAASLPFVLLFYEFSVSKSVNVKKYFLRFWPYFLVFVLYCALTVLHKYNPAPQKPLAWKLWLVVYNQAWYLFKTIWPGELSPVYPKIIFPGFDFLPVVFVWAFALGAAILAIKKSRDNFLYNVLPLAACYIIAVAPISGLFQISTDYFDSSDRYSYIPSAFLLLGAALVWEKLPLIVDSLYGSGSWCSKALAVILKKKIIIGACFVLYLIYLGSLSFFYIDSWKSYRQLMVAGALHNPPGVLPLVVLGIMAKGEGDYETTLRLSDRIRSLTKGIMPEKERLRRVVLWKYLKGSTLMLQGKKKEAFFLFKSIIPAIHKIPEPFPGIYARMHLLMADCFLEQGNTSKAIACFETATRILENSGKAGSADSFFYKGMKFFIEGDFKKAAKAFGAAHEKDPENKMILHNLKQAELKASQN